MNCRNHPDRAATAVCQKLGTGFCGECCECRDVAECCGCLDPQVYCTFRTRCLIWEMSRRSHDPRVRADPAAEGAFEP